MNSKTKMRQSLLKLSSSIAAISCLVGISSAYAEIPVSNINPVSVEDAQFVRSSKGCLVALVENGAGQIQAVPIVDASGHPKCDASESK